MAGLWNEENLYFTDINPISGLEQNSFLFRQASLLGMTHRQALEYILKVACLCMDWLSREGRKEENAIEAACLCLVWEP